MNYDYQKIPLRDIHLPEAVSWWPPAPGWWILLVLIVLLFVIFGWYLHYRRARRIKKTALKKLQSINAAYTQNGNSKQLAENLSALLRRVCISYFPNVNIASITGKKWLVFLDTGLPDKAKIGKLRFSNGIGEVLIVAPYQRIESVKNIDGGMLLQLCHTWLSSIPLDADKYVDKLHRELGGQAGQNG